MLIDGTKTDIKSIHSSGEVDALEKIRLEMIEMLRIDEECEIVDEKIRIKVKKEEKVTSNLETLVTPLEKEIDKCLSLRRSSRNIKKSNYNDPNDSLDCLKALNQKGMSNLKYLKPSNEGILQFLSNSIEIWSRDQF